jgi:hypothetical protein
MQALGGPSFQRLNCLGCKAIRWRLRFLTDRRRRFMLKNNSPPWGKCARMRASAGKSMPADKGWSRRFEDPIPLPRAASL